MDHGVSVSDEPLTSSFYQQNDREHD